MSENVAPATAPGKGGDVPGQPFLDEQRAKLRKLLEQKRVLEHQLAQQEDEIYKKETDYLDETPSGNIITGFDAYTKGAGAGAVRRRGGVNEGNRVFSRSSISFNANAESPMPSAQSTPVAALAPTPLSSSFMKEHSGSNHATPTSATSATRTGAGVKKNKKTGGEDSETDTKEVKKARVVSVATRK